MRGPTFAGQLVTLAPLKTEHLEHYVEWFADPEVTRYLTLDLVFTLKQEEEWLDRISRSNSDVACGIFAEGQHIGGTGITQINWRSRHAVTGIIIGDKSWWGRGAIARLALTSRRGHLQEFAAWQRAIADLLDGLP